MTRLSLSYMVFGFIRLRVAAAEPALSDAPYLPIAKGNLRCISRAV